MTGRRKPARNKGLPGLSEKEIEEELARKAERNRVVFQAWLEKKKEEQKVSVVATLYMSILASTLILPRVQIKDS